MAANPIEPDLALHKASQTFSGTFSGTVLGLTWLCTKAPDLLRNLRNLLRNLVEPDLRLHQCIPELFWAEDPISLRCWGKIYLHLHAYNICIAIHMYIYMYMYIYIYTCTIYTCIIYMHVRVYVRTLVCRHEVRASL